MDIFKLWRSFIVRQMAERDVGYLNHEAVTHE